jgi:hypothetical protein
MDWGPLGPQSPFSGCATAEGRSIFRLGRRHFSKGNSMFTQLHATAMRVSLAAALVVTAAVAAGWKWNRPPLF